MDGKTGKEYIIYKHTSPTNKVYIGLTKRTWQQRGGHNGIQYKRKNIHFWNAIQKYGWDNFTHEILCSGLTREEATLKEQEYIVQYQSNNPQYGYNLTSGGEVGFHFTDEVRKKLSQKTTQQWQHEEIRSRMIDSLKKSHANLPLSELQIQANMKRRGRHLSEETKQKMRGHTPWNKGKHSVISEDARRRQSEAHKGKIPANKGKHLSEEEKRVVSEKTRIGMNKPEVKQKIREANKRNTGKRFKYYVYQFQLDGTLVEIHRGYANAFRKTNVAASSIRSCVLGKNKTAGGYVWRISATEEDIDEIKRII